MRQSELYGDMPTKPMNLDILGFAMRPARVALAGLAADAAPRLVFLFSGHMIDAPGRKIARFPLQSEPLVTQAIADLMAQLDAGPADLAICGGACGGDLIFAEAALSRGSRVQLYLPFDEPTFLARCVDIAGMSWRARFEAVKSRAALDCLTQTLQYAESDDLAFERNNVRMLESALRYDPQKLQFIALWDGRPGDGPGGTQHMVESVRRSGARCHMVTVLQAGT